MVDIKKTELRPVDDFSFGDGYEVDSSRDGVERFVFMHNPRGIRAEYNICRGTLELWVSPQAHRSTDYRDRNFSNRDDHTRLFDRIFLPYLPESRFTGCDYDPFHSVLHFGTQSLHVLMPVDQPAVVLWFSEPEEVDIKSDKADTVCARDTHAFCISHPDRGRIFTFAAAMGPGAGEFAHQRTLDQGRSIFARARLAPGQALALCAELSFEPVGDIARLLAGQTIADLTECNQRNIERLLAPSRVSTPANPKLQRQYDMNKRVILSCQDMAGSMRASLKFMYYLIWQVDGCMTAAPLGCSGWLAPLTNWNRFSCANPIQSDDWPGHRFFGQLVNRISKWEEHGNFLAIWAAFTHWTQSGSDLFTRGPYAEVLKDAIRWIEAYSYDEGMGTFGARFVSEQPYYGSRDFGWDEALGRVMKMKPARHNGAIIRRRFDFHTNIQMWECYLMLSAMSSGAEAQEYARKASLLESRLEQMAGYANGVATDGLYELEDGSYSPIHESAGIRPIGGHFFGLHYWDMLSSWEGTLEKLHHEITGGRETFATTALGTLCRMDTEFIDEARIVEILDIFVANNERAGSVLPMAYAMHEKINFREGGYHDTRPQLFSIGPFQQAVVNLMVRRLAFGIAARSSATVNEVNDYEYLGRRLSFVYDGDGLRACGLEVNGTRLNTTLQIPHALLASGDNRIRVLRTAAGQGPLLVWSTVELIDATQTADAVRYEINAFGPNALIWRGEVAPEVTHVPGDADARAVIPRVEVRDSHTLVQFEGRGLFTIAVRLRTPAST